MAFTPPKGLAIVAGAYALGLILAAAVLLVLPGAPPMARLALAAVVATVVVFVFSRVFNNTSLYEPYWGLYPVGASVWLYVGQGAGTVRALLVLLLVALWGWRLTLSWARSWKGLDHEKWRYADLKQASGSAWPLASALGLHLFPTVTLVLGLSPAHAAFTSTRSFSLLDAVAVPVTALGFGIEAAADEQLRRFLQRPSAAICNLGLWRYSRHPNFFGELVFWFGLWLFGVAAGGPWWTLLGPLAMVGLFGFANIPLRERRVESRRPGYEEHRRRTSMLVPWPPKPEA